MKCKIFEQKIFLLLIALILAFSIPFSVAATVSTSPGSLVLYEVEPTTPASISIDMPLAEAEPTSPESLTLVMQEEIAATPASILVAYKFNFTEICFEEGEFVEGFEPLAIVKFKLSDTDYNLSPSAQVVLQWYLSGESVGEGQIITLEEANIDPHGKHTLVSRHIVPPIHPMNNSYFSAEHHEGKWVLQVYFLE